MGLCIQGTIFLIPSLNGDGSELYLNDLNNSISGVLLAVFIGSLALRIYYILISILELFYRFSTGC